MYSWDSSNSPVVDVVSTATSMTISWRDRDFGRKLHDVIQPQKKQKKQIINVVSVDASKKSGDYFERIYIYIYYFNFRHNEIDMDIIGYRDIQYQPEQIVSRMFPST